MGWTIAAWVGVLVWGVIFGVSAWYGRRAMKALATARAESRPDLGEDQYERLVRESDVNPAEVSRRIENDPKPDLRVVGDD